MTEPPSPMFACKCGQSIYKQAGDDMLICHDCGREYEKANDLDVVHVLCPRCSAEITDVGRFYVSHEPKKWVVDNVECPDCDYNYQASVW